MMFLDSLIWGQRPREPQEELFVYLFEPMLTIALDGGPMNTIPSVANVSANLAFSLRNP